MIKDLSRFFLVVASILIGLLIAWYGLWKVAQQPLSKKAPPLAIQGLLKIVPGQALAATQNLSPGPIVHGIGAPFEGSWNFELENGAKPLPIRDFLQANPKTFLALEVRTEDPKPLANLKRLLDDGDLWKRVLILSSSDKILKDMRAIAPRWSYGTGEVFLTRYLILSSMKLERLLEIPGDAFYIPNRRVLKDYESKKLAKFAREQGIPSIFGTENTSPDQEPLTLNLLKP